MRKIEILTNTLPGKSLCGEPFFLGPESSQFFFGVRYVDLPYAEVRAWLETFEHSMYTDATSIDALVIKALIEQILVYEDHIEVQFKCGATVEQEYVK